MKMSMMSHPTWVRGLKLTIYLRFHRLSLSHPTWVRGLKHAKQSLCIRMQESHPTWVRGLKLIVESSISISFGRTLRGCVD